MCEQCVMDTTDPEIKFYGSKGCSNCRTAKSRYSKIMGERKQLKSIVQNVRHAGRGKKYDCIIGLSGGVDSSYVAYITKKLHLRPLAVHFDNGWNSDLAVQNIKNILEKLEIDLYTYVVEWEEFRDLQLSFLEASTPDSEIPTDHAIMALLYQIAMKHHVKYIIDGCNIETESVLPRYWSYGHGDWRYIKNIQKQFGTKKLKTFPHYNRFQKMIYDKVLHIERIHILNYVPYNKERVKEKLRNELGWKDYGEKHDESFYTKFYQNYILPEKFGYDKRKMHLSSLIVSRQISRDAALEELKKTLYTEEQKVEARKYFCEKMNLSEQRLDEIMKSPKRTYWDYPNYENDLLYRLQQILK